MQVFSRPTYDRIAKHILSNDESVRIDILKSFTGLNSIRTATQLDEHYNPFDPFSNLRKLLNSSSSQTFIEKIRNSSNIKLLLEDKENKNAPDFLRGLGTLYDDLIHAFPDHKYRSSVDFLCETDFGYVTIEFQVAKQDYWDKRALAYAANIYGRQLRPREDAEHLKNVVGINLLGDGSTPYWKDGNFVRDYVFIDQKNSMNKIPALRLVQYSLGDAEPGHKDLVNNPKLKQWIEFFKSAHEQQETPTSVDEPVKKAYQMIRVDVLKKEHPDLLKASEEFFNSLTEHDKAVEEKALVKVVKNMLNKGSSIEEISSTTGLSAKEVKKIQEETKKLSL
jgi:predicted transposase/invertase (TIGR01784 family)